MITDQIRSDQVQAMKAGDSSKVSVLRYILAQIKNKEIEKKTSLTDEEALTVLRKSAKELKESIEAFKKGGREDLLKDNEKQLKIISAYLPQEISDEEITKSIDELVQKNQEAIKQNSKAIIGIVMKELRGKADPQRIIKILNEKIK